VAVRFKKSGPRCPREMTVLLPKLDEKKHPKVFEPPLTEGILDCYKSGKLQNISVLVNRKPTYSENINGYFLNFHGRVSKASVKNFQMVDANDDSKVLLQFGRIGKDEFTMDLHYPVSPLQAFAVCLSTFDYKIGD